MKKWRQELVGLMSAAGSRRPPALRRSTSDHFLLATDFPMAADEQAVQRFLTLLYKSGWHAAVTGYGWILLDRAGTFDAADISVPPKTPESDCCLSLLRRHHGLLASSDGRAERMLLKALEEGTEAYGRVCETLHAEWAVLLRKHARIPAVDERFFGGLL